MMDRDVWVRAHDGTVLAFGRIPAEWGSVGMWEWAWAREGQKPGRSTAERERVRASERESGSAASSWKAVSLATDGTGRERVSRTATRDEPSGSPGSSSPSDALTLSRSSEPAPADLIALAHGGPVHFMGICGAGMSALAEMVLRAGGRVTGCDAQPSEAADHLRSLGAVVVEGHDPAHGQDAVAVVATAAVPQDHAELVAARKRGIPVVKRAQALAAVVNRGRLAAVAGTHGKTTTTAMTTEILAAAGLEPTGFVGGRVPTWGSGLRPGRDDLFVVEADEYDRSFLHLRPEAIVVTSVEADHLDVYGSLEQVENAFAQFIGLLAPDGLVAACTDDPGVQRLLRRADRAGVLRYGTGPEAELRAAAIDLLAEGSRFRLVEGGEALGWIELRAPGMHNVRNALGAFALARHFGADLAAAQRALADFDGVGRRFERLAAGNIALVTDYAHHPTEIEATLAAARGAFRDRRLVAAFQPHLYSRTKDFAADFGRSLAAADIVFVTDVYAARELPVPGVTGELVADATRRAGGRAVYYHPDITTLPETLSAFLMPGDACIAMGAGSIDGAARALARLLAGRA